MTKREAAKVKVGDIVRSDFYRKTGTVEAVYAAPCPEAPEGNFPLFKVSFGETLTFKLLQRD